MSTLPEKWAVEIQSLQDAERLQELFPDAVATSRSIIHLPKLFLNGKYQYGHEPICLCATSYGVFDNHNWRYSNKNYYTTNGYTIVSISELENLLK